jgi:hypothetical protein
MLAALNLSRVLRTANKISGLMSAIVHFQEAEVWKQYQWRQHGITAETLWGGYIASNNPGALVNFSSVVSTATSVAEEINLI